MADINETPLADFHREIGGKMVPFAGWNMPVQYSNIIKEHTAVREKVGVFDISHMGQFFLSGKGAGAWVNTMLTNDIEKLSDDDAQYTMMLNEHGGVIDDLIIYKLSEDHFFLVVNASKIDEDYQWLSSHLPEDISLTNESDTWAGMAVQGPEAVATFCSLFSDTSMPERNKIVRFEKDGASCIVCRTGYTGEDGFEFFCDASHGEKWFKLFIDAGAEPCGLGARDSLRLEVCFPLNGSDLSAQRTPLQAGLGFFCAMDKESFMGKSALLGQKENGLADKLTAIQYTGKGAPPRAGYEVYSTDGEKIGELSSGVLSPSLKVGVCMAYLPMEYTVIDTELKVDVRGRSYPAKVVKKPFYKKA